MWIEFAWSGLLILVWFRSGLLWRALVWFSVLVWFGLCLICFFACWLACLLACWLAGWLAGLLACLLAGWLACLLACLPACLPALLLACLLVCLLGFCLFVCLFIFFYISVGRTDSDQLTRETWILPKRSERAICQGGFLGANKFKKQTSGASGTPSRRKRQKDSQGTAKV